MELVPSIDLRNGRVVRLRQGVFATETRYRLTPKQLYRRYSAAGARYVHIVDLDGARDGVAANYEILRSLAELKGSRIQAGGGVRRLADVARLLAAGVERVVAGSVAIESPDQIADWISRFGADHLVAALDVRLEDDGTPRLVTHGWQRESRRSLWDAVASLSRAGLQACAMHRYCARRSNGRAECQFVSRMREALPKARLAGLWRRTRRRRFARAGQDPRFSGDQRQGTTRRLHSTTGARAILARRIIPCLDVRDGQVVKGVQFRNHRVVGDILELAGRYRDEGADELVFYDITASPEGRRVDREWIGRIARILDIPFCVAGGIRSVADAEEVLGCGAEKLSINSPALERPQLIDDLARRFRYAMRRRRHR